MRQERRETRHVVTKEQTIPEEKKTEEKPVKKETDKPPVIVQEVKAEEIKRYIPKKITGKKPPTAREIKALRAKNAENRTEFLDVGLVGQTAACKDFRVICKKNGLLINTTLNTILHEWNTINYNL